MKKKLLKRQHSHKKSLEHMFPISDRKVGGAETHIKFVIRFCHVPLPPSFLPKRTEHTQLTSPYRFLSLRLFPPNEMDFEYIGFKVLCAFDVSSCYCHCYSPLPYITFPFSPFLRASNLKPSPELLPAKRFVYTLLKL